MEFSFFLKNTQILAFPFFYGKHVRMCFVNNLSTINIVILIHFILYMENIAHDYLCWKIWKLCPNLNGYNLFVNIVIDFYDGIFYFFPYFFSKKSACN